MKKFALFGILTLILAVSLGAEEAKFKGYHHHNFFGEDILPAEDIEVLSRYRNIIGVLKDPKIKTASEEKYNAAMELAEKVDLSFVRETQTLNQLFYHGDAIIDSPNTPDRIITFYYEWQDHSIRLVFHAYTKFIVRVDIHRK